MGAPKSFSVCDTLYWSRRLCFCSGRNSGRSMSDMASRNCNRSYDVVGHSHMTGTSSSWYISPHFVHVLFSSVTGLFHMRDIKVSVNRRSIVPQLSFSTSLLFMERLTTYFQTDFHGT